MSEELNKLKLLAGQKVVEMDDKSQSAKKHMLRYIKEADEYEVKSFLLDRTLEPVEEDSKKIIDSRIKRSNILNEAENALLEASPAELFFKQIKNAPGDLKKAAQDFVSNAGANTVDRFPGLKEIPKAYEKVIKKNPQGSIEKVQDKGSKILDWLSKKLDLGNISDKFGQGLKEMQTLAQQNPSAAAAGILFALIASVSYGIMKKKGADDKEAKQKVYASLQKNDKLDKEHQKAAKAVAKTYKK